MINLINYWIIILILSNVFLYLAFSLFLNIRFYKKINICNFIKNLILYKNYFIIILLIVSFHLIEVNLIDQIITDWVKIDFAYTIQNIEGNIVYNLSFYWQPFLIYFFVIMYIIIYPFTLWFSTYYYILIRNKKALIFLTYGLLIIYIFAIPFYLFLPVTNVYKFYNLDSTLNNVIPNIENFFYLTTTKNNCFPSLHVAMSILIARASIISKNKMFSYILIFSMCSVIVSVMYLTIHWLMDIIFGIIFAIVTIFIIDKTILVD